MKTSRFALGLAGGVALGGGAFILFNTASTFLFQMRGIAPASPPPAVAQERAPSTTAPQPENMVAAIDIEAGEKVFKKCAACHTADEGGPHRTGPNLWNIVGRAAASTPDFSYSEAMLAQAGNTWGAARLDEYLTKPKDMVPGTTMSFAGLPKVKDRHNLIAWLATQSDQPIPADALGFALPTEPPAAAAEEPAQIAQIPYQNPPERTPDQQAEIEAKVAALKAEIDGIDYGSARYHPLHFPPAISTASNEECLVCHQEIMTYTPREESLAGVKASDSLAWYQTLDTYTGNQESFHFRHLQSDFAQEVMNLECNFCHKGNDPREESPDMIPTRAAFSAPKVPEFTNRKMVNPETTCLRCHGAMPDPVNIMGLSAHWPEARLDLEDPEDPDMVNGCESCHAELFRTNRHNVAYLKAANIEALAKEVSSDTCYGCHGGRAWYRTSYPYPRHPWPDMDPETPEWAAGRPTASDPEYRLAPTAND